MQTLTPLRIDTEARLKV